MLALPLFGQSTDPVAAFNVAALINQPGFPANLADVSINAKQEFVDYVRAKSALQQSAFSATFGPLLRSAENGRVDEQAGASATAAGTASAAEKAGITGLVTAALENGALTQTLDQNLLTVRGNAEGLFRFLSGQDVIPICLDAASTNCDPSPLSNLELTASFDVSQSNTQAVTGQNPADGTSLAALLTSNKRQFSSASARFAILNSRDLRSKNYRDAWSKWFVQNKAGLLKASADLLATQAFYDKIQAIDADGKKTDFARSLYRLWEVNAESVYHETDVPDEQPYRKAPKTPELQAVLEEEAAAARHIQPVHHSL